MKIVEQIKVREAFTPTENEISQYLLKNAKVVVNMSLDELADKIYVSKSTIIRFCKKLGFKGHKELCITLARELESFFVEQEKESHSPVFQKDDSTEEVARKAMNLIYRALMDTYKELDYSAINEVVSLIDANPNVYIYTSSEDFNSAKVLRTKLIGLGMRAVLAESIENAKHYVLRQSKDSIALFFSYEPITNDLLALFQTCLKKNMNIVLIGGPNINEYDANIVKTIRVAYHEESQKITKIGERIGMVYIVEMLYALLFKMHYEENMKYIDSQDNTE